MTPERSSAQERWLRFFNQVVYASMAPVYNSLDWLTFGAWWRLVRRALDYVPPDQRVLEVAFGPGKLQVELARRSTLCAGIDLAWGMCRYTDRRLHQAGLPQRIVRGSAFKLPYPADCFDIVVSTFALSGLHPVEPVYTEMARVLRQGGQLVVVDIGLPSNGSRAGIFWARLWERMGDYLYDQAAQMQQAGLSVTTVTEFGPGQHIRVVVGEKH